MQIFDRYLFRHLVIATVLTAVTLAAVILLTQSFQFLELVINAGASGSAFWLLTLLALPRFFEIILPIALMAGTVFVYNRMAVDQELTAMRAVGTAPVQLARPALILSGATVLVLLLITTWLAPASLSGMQQLRQVIKAQYSALLFREGVFNAVRPGLTVFMRDRTENGDLHGLIIYDSRPENETPVTIIAKRGQITATPQGQQVLVYDGLRQTIDPRTRALSRLAFDRYTLDVPDGSGPVQQRWREPDERTFLQLLRPDDANARDVENRREFMVEIHRRLVSPLLAAAYTALALAFLLLGPVDRRGQGWRVSAAVSATVLVQGLYLAAIALSRKSDWGLVLMYMFALGPLAAGLLMLGGRSEAWRQRIFARRRKVAA